MDYAFAYRRMVQFSDTDMAGIVHFSRFSAFMEEAEHAFLRTLGLSVHQDRPDGLLCWPRVHVSCDFQSPVRFEDQIDIGLALELGAKSATYRFDMKCAGRQVATGKIVAACCRWVGAGAERRLRAVPIPDDVRKLLTVG